MIQLQIQLELKQLMSSNIIVGQGSLSTSRFLIVNMKQNKKIKLIIKTETSNFANIYNVPKGLAS